ncbi:MAG: hypothetical protein GX590_03835 [Lentisphaerae bacterium]|nr:hypothetical protein [Lentisphaerota bacterium]
MRDVIEKVIQAEAEARAIVADAEREAEALLQKARTEAQRLREQDRVAVLAEQDRLVAEALEEAGRQCRRQIEAFAQDLKNRVRLDAATRQRAVQQVVEFVRGTA